MQRKAPPRVHLMDLIERDIIRTNEGRDTTRMAIVDTSGMQLDKAGRGKTSHFDVWLTIEGEDVKGSNTSVCAASPSEGIFVLYEIKGFKLDFEKVDGCHVVTYDRGYVEADTRVKFYGLRSRPKRCITLEDRWFSRAVVAWNTVPVSVTPTDKKRKGDIEDLRI